MGGAGSSAGYFIIEYSTDGGRTWSTTVPTITNVGNVTVQVRASNPDYAPVEATVTLHIDPRTVVVTVNNVSKLAGNPDPEWSVTIEGLLDGDYAYAAAVDLFNSVINTILLVTVNWISRRKSETSLF